MGAGNLPRIRKLGHNI